MSNPEDQWIEDCKNACPYCGGSGHKDDIRADLTRQAPKVKALEWRNSYGVLRAETAFGDYIVTGNILRIGPMSCEMVSEDPKAAAQADYERRILSALEE